MSIWLVSIGLTLAVYRAAHMVAVEEGPFGVFDELRKRIDPAQKTWLGRGLNCILCASFWLALPAALLLSSLPVGQSPDLRGVTGFWWADWLALAGSVLALHKWLTRR